MLLKRVWIVYGSAEIMSPFKELLLQHIERRILSRRQIALAADVPPPTFYTWLRDEGTKNPQYPDQVLRVAKVLKLSKVQVNALLKAAGMPSIKGLQLTAQQPNKATLREDLKHWIRVVPKQAPLPIHDFIGRTPLLPTLTSHIQNGAVIVLHGMGGCGKSTLANWLAAELGDGFVDGVLWGDFSQTVVEQQLNEDALMSILANWMQTYGRDVSEQKTLESRQTAFRDMMGQKNALILLDDVPDNRVVESLLPSDSTCTFLITTREKELLAAIKPVSLRVPSFGDDEGLQLIELLTGKQQVMNELATVQEILQRVERLPLAVRIVGATIARVSSLTFADYARLLTKSVQRILTQADKARDAERTLYACFEISYQRLTADEQALFGSIGALPERRFSAEILSAASNQPDAMFETLPQLLMGSLIENDGANRGYRIHTLLHVYAQQKLADQPTQQKIVQQRLIEYVQRICTDSARDDTSLAREWRVIRAVTNSLCEEKEVGRVSQIVHGLTEPRLGEVGFLDAQGHWGEAAKWLAWLGEESAESHYKRGAFAFRRGERESADFHLTHALTLAKQQANTLLIGYISEFLVRLALKHARDPEASFDILEDAIGLQTGELRDYLMILQGQLLARRLDAMTAARTAILSGLAGLPAENSIGHVIGRNSLLVINLLTNSTNWEVMLEDATLALSHTVNNLRLRGTILQNRALCYQRVGAVEAAQTDLSEVISLAEQLGDVDLLARTQLNLAIIYQMQNKLDMAETLLEIAASDAKKYEYYQTHALLLASISTGWIIRSNAEQATIALDQAKELRQIHGVHALVGNLDKQYAEVAFLQNDFAKAIDYLNRAINDSKRNPLEQGSAFSLMGRTLDARNEHEDAAKWHHQACRHLHNRDVYEEAQALMWHDRSQQLRGQRTSTLFERARTQFGRLGAVRQIAMIDRWLTK